MQHSGQPPALIDGKLPVFVFPTSLYFYSDDQTSHKQVLTVYNPYDFPLKFKVLCTTPKKYAVVDSEGSIKSRCCVDIVVRHKDVAINNEGMKDKFRIHVTEYGQKAVIGRKEIIAVLLPTKDRNQPPEEKFESLPPPIGLASVAPQDTHTTPSLRHGFGSGSSPSMVVIVAAVLCIVALMLPTYGDSDTSLPSYLCLSSNQKLIAAYILGLVTMAILHS